MLSSLSVRLWMESKRTGSTLSAASGIQRAYTMYIRDLGPTNRDAPRHLTEKINYKKLDLTRMVELHIEGLEGTAYTLIAYSKALKQKVRLVIWIMPNGKHKLFFSTKTSMSGEDVLRTYRSRFQIEFCFRDAKQYTGLTHCQARHKNQLDFSYNASFASQNVVKVMMKENGMPYSMASFKEVMASTYIAKLIFDNCRRIPNRKLISHTVKELFGWAA